MHLSSKSPAPTDIATAMIAKNKIAYLLNSSLQLRDGLVLLHLFVYRRDAMHLPPSVGAIRVELPGATHVHKKANKKKWEKK